MTGCQSATLVFSSIQFSTVPSIAVKPLAVQIASRCCVSVENNQICRFPIAPVKGCNMYVGSQSFYCHFCGWVKMILSSGIHFPFVEYLFGRQPEAILLLPSPLLTKALKTMARRFQMDDVVTDPAIPDKGPPLLPTCIRHMKMTIQSIKNRK